MRQLRILARAKLGAKRSQSYSGETPDHGGSVFDSLTGPQLLAENAKYPAVPVSLLGLNFFA